MSNSKTWIRSSRGTVVSLILVAIASVLAGQALCLAEGETQQSRVEASVSMPSARAEVASDAANEAVYGQRYIGLYEGGDFIGDVAVTREQLLIVLDRVLRDIEDGRILVESMDAQLLREVILGQQEQIVQLNNRIEVLEAEMHERNKRDVVLTEQTLEVTEQANDLLERLEMFSEDLKQWARDQAVLNSEQISVFREELTALGDGLAALHESIAASLGGSDDLDDDTIRSLGQWHSEAHEDLATRLNKVDERVPALAIDIEALAGRMSNLRTDTQKSVNDLASRVDDLESELTDASMTQQSLEETIKTQQQRISELERQLAVIKSRYEADLKSLSDSVLALSAKLAALESSR